jgi:hypothetical protein
LNKILSDDYQKLVILNINTGEEIAVITEDSDTPINTASEDIVVKLIPECKQRMKYYFVHDAAGNNHLYAAENEENARQSAECSIEVDYLYELTGSTFKNEGWIMTAK